MTKNSEKLNIDKECKIMKKANLENEKIKNKYFDYLKESQGYSEPTINAHKKAIYRYEEFSDFEDFTKFNKKRAVDYKKWIEEKKVPQSGKQISLTTVYHYIRNLREFFKWLSAQPSYRSKIIPTDIDYLKLQKAKSRIATSSKRERYPTFEQVKKVIETIEIKSEIDLRDRALLSFTLLSGMRDSAITTLSLGCFDEAKLLINQDPKLGVKTKFSKTIRSYLFKFDEQMLGYFLDWYKYLKTEKLFGNNDPIFPRNKIENAENSKNFSSNSVEPKYWQSVSSMREIFKQRFENAEIEYFSPHTFRHLAVITAISKCRSGHEIKAVSQNFGHEDVGTTMMTYGTLNNSQVGDIISGMSFSNDTSKDSHIMQKLKALLEQEDKGNF